MPKVLALPGFVWKQLTGEEVSWSKDFPAVDSVLVSHWVTIGLWTLFILAVRLLLSRCLYIWDANLAEQLS